MNKRKFSRRTKLALAASCGLFSTSYLSAQVTSTPEVIWDGGGTSGSTGSYVDPANWNPDGTPANASSQFVEINDTGTAVVNVGDAAEGTFLNLGLRPGDTGNLAIHGGTLTIGELRVGGRETINSDFTNYTNTAVYNPNGGGTGSVVQDGGAVSVNYVFGAGEPPVQSLYIGDGGLTAATTPPAPNTANGSYTISGGTLTVGVGNTDNGIFIATGSGSTGAFTQSGAALSTSTVTSTGSMTVGRAGGTGTYSISGGTLNIDSVTATALPLFVGNGAALGGGTAFVAGTSGTFTQTGGAVAVQNNGYVTIGSSGGSGGYSISNGTLSINSNSLIIGDAASADGTTAIANTVGTFTQTGGAVTVGLTLEIGRRSGTGTYTMSAGTLSTVGDLRIGSNATSSAAPFQSSVGTLNLSGTGAITVGGNLNVDLSNSSASQGTLAMSGGSISLTASAAVFAVGNGAGANGTVTQSAGTITLNGTTANLDMGRTTALSASYTLSNTGSLSAKTITFEPAAPTSGSPSRIFNMTGGTLTATTVNFGTGAPTTPVSGATNVRSLNISGGSATIGTITQGQFGTTYISGAPSSFSLSTLNLTQNGTFRVGTTNPLSLSTAVTLLTTGTGTVQVDSGSTLTFAGNFATGGTILSKTGAGTLTISGTQTNSGTTAAFTNSSGGGTLNLNTNSGVSTTVNASSGTTNFGSTQNLRTMTVASEALAVVTENPTPTTTNKVVSLGALTTVNGKLDLTNNKLITTSAIGTLTASTYSGIQGLVQSGRNGGAWNGNGIITSETSAGPGRVLTTLGTATGAIAKGISGTTTASWGGQTVTPTSTLVMYTYAGDTNLDGKINGDDYFRIDTGYSSALSGYANGDLNYDGRIDADDYFLIDSNYVAQSTAFANGSAVEAGLPVGLGAVPEPASLTILSLAGLSARRRRRRR